ncbi:MAG TPA: hypothetical protein DCZ69_03630 [Syntrophobacteraceae bacterium]|nr:hypothetical protein [Syntrophobacteraceae bacterium]
MTESISTADLAKELDAIYRSDASRAEALMEGLLAERFADHAPATRMVLLDQVIREFREVDAAAPVISETRFNEEVFTGLFSLVLGKEITQSDIPVAVLHERLRDSLNTVFDSLNELIGVIHQTLSSQGEEVETIRSVIGSKLWEEGGHKPLEDYLGQIKKSFLVAHQAFKEAAKAKVMQILSELSPDRMADGFSGSGLGFGPFRKAELFEQYQQKFKQCLDWFTDGRFEEELLREFERRCQQLSK